MLKTSIALTVAGFILAGCRGEPVPRDYQNAPPGMTRPADDASEAPSTTAITSPELSQGAEGTSAPYEPVDHQTTPAETSTGASPRIPENAVTTTKKANTASPSPRP